MHASSATSHSHVNNTLWGKFKRECPCLDGKALAKIGAIALAAIATIVCFIFLPWQVGVCAAILALGATIWAIADCTHSNYERAPEGRRAVFLTRFVDPWYMPISRHFSNLRTGNVESRLLARRQAPLSYSRGPLYNLNHPSNFSLRGPVADDAKSSTDFHEHKGVPPSSSISTAPGLHDPSRVRIGDEIGTSSSIFGRSTSYPAQLSRISEGSHESTSTASFHSTSSSARNPFSTQAASFVQAPPRVPKGRDSAASGLGRSSSEYDRKDAISFPQHSSTASFLGGSGSSSRPSSFGSSVPQSMARSSTAAPGSDGQRREFVGKK